jgi:soluble lytic murein transglycosylase-like protein
VLQGAHAIRFVVVAAGALVVALSSTLAVAESHPASQEPAGLSGQPKLVAANRGASPPPVAAARNRLDASWQAELTTTQSQLVRDKQQQDAAAAQARAQQAQAAAQAQGAAQQKAPAQQQAQPDTTTATASAGSIQQVIQQVFAPLGPAAVQWALTIARRESNYDPRAQNPSGAAGLFQFMPSTFAKSPPGQAGKSIWDPEASAEAAAWMYMQGRQSEWATNY